jgi:hypothetical protein
MLRFRFQLRPVADVGGWGTDGRNLHWFGLTDGWYWIENDGVELLRYSDATTSGRAPGDPPYVDYYVVRLWEDMLSILPEVLEPVPVDLRGFIESERERWAERDEDEEDFVAEIWHGRHGLDMGYLRHPPQLQWWRAVGADDDLITLVWRNPQGSDISYADPVAGRMTMPTGEFIAAVEELDRALMAAMETRVAEFERLGPPPDRNLDVVGLRREHEDRRGWLAARRARTVSTDWDAVRAGARFLQSG